VLQRHHPSEFLDSRNQSRAASDSAGEKKSCMILLFEVVSVDVQLRIHSAWAPFRVRWDH
jgi:hypothetical protein